MNDSKPIPNAVRMSTATLAAVKKELNKVKGTVTSKSVNGLKVIIDDSMAFNTSVVGFYDPSKGFVPA